MSEQNAADTSSYNAAEEYSGGDYGNSDFESSESGEPTTVASRARGWARARAAGGVAGSGRTRLREMARVSPGVTGDAGPQIVPLVMEGESLALAASAAPHSRRGGSRRPGQPTGSAAGRWPAAGRPGGKRWKKKFRDRERRPGGGSGGGAGTRIRATTSGLRRARRMVVGIGGGNGYRPDNFGNQAGGFKRKGKGGGGQPRERGFVGPMDHSYRASGRVWRCSAVDDPDAGTGAQKRTSAYGGFAADRPLDAAADSDS